MGVGKSLSFVFFFKSLTVIQEMAIEYPEYHFTGIDMADMFPTTIRPDNIKFQRQNILLGLPYPDNTFDFVNMRLMLSAFRVTEWPTVIGEIHRVLKQGGVVELMETKFPVKIRFYAEDI